MISLDHSQAFHDAIRVINSPRDRFSERERRMAQFILDTRNGTPARQTPPRTGPGLTPALRRWPPGPTPDDTDGPRAA